MRCILDLYSRQSGTHRSAARAATVLVALTEGHVTADGKLSACCFDTNAHWTMGDLTKYSFIEAWNSEAFVKLREAHLKRDVRGTVCEKCIAYKLDGE